MKPNTANKVTDKGIECIVTGKRSMEDLPEQSEPFAIIKYGPTGSGKGSAVVLKEIEALGVNPADCATFEIDSVVESIGSYRRNTYKAKKNYNKTFKNRKSSNEFFKTLSNIYFGVRGTIDEQFTNVLANAIRMKRHIIFETTGTNFNGTGPLEWLLDLIAKKGPAYKIVLMYPLVKPAELQRRVALRGEEQMSEKKNEANRFYRGIDPATLPELAIKSMMNLTHFVLPSVFVKKIHKLIVVWNQ